MIQVLEDVYTVLDLETQNENEEYQGWMRTFYAYGPRQRSTSLVPSILNSLQEGKLPQLRTPLNANDFVYVDDVAEAFSKAVSRDIPSGIYHLGSGVSTPVLEVCRMADRIWLRLFMGLLVLLVCP